MMVAASAVEQGSDHNVLLQKPVTCNGILKQWNGMGAHISNQSCGVDRVNRGQMGHREGSFGRHGRDVYFFHK